MLIKCLIARKGGTLATIDGVDYLFDPFCKVEDVKHQKAFLAIKEAYCEVENIIQDSAQTVAAKKQKQPKAVDEQTKAGE